MSFDDLYRNPFSYLGIPWYRDCPEADVVVSGVPFDMATSGRSGARFGPTGIRQASANLIWDNPRWPWNFSVLERLKIADAGDVDFNPGEPSHLEQQLAQHARTLLSAGKTMLTFGGDHYIALPLIREHARVHGPLALIHFDAHTDTAADGTDYYHGSMFYHAVNEGLLLPEHSVQVGIRTSYEREGHPFTVLDVGWVNDQGPAKTLEKIRDIVADKPAYISFDIDCLDPSVAPGTGTPVAGGLNSDTALKLIRGLRGLDIKGMDVVEVAPAYDHAEVTSLAAATIAYDMLHLLV